MFLFLFQGLLYLCRAKIWLWCERRRLNRARTARWHRRVAARESDRDPVVVEERVEEEAKLGSQSTTAFHMVVEDVSVNKVV